MLIPLSRLVQDFGVHITGVLHVGAHECEEREAYLAVDTGKGKLTDANIYWVEAQEHLVKRAAEVMKIPHIFQAVVSDTDDQQVNFIVTNNMQSSSILELEDHKTEHPWVVEIQRYPVTTTRLDTLISRSIGSETFRNSVNFVNLDIQGAELLALRGLGEFLDSVQYIYTEVNTRPLYRDCALLPEMDAFLEEKHGFKRVAIEMTAHNWGDAFYVRG